MVPAADALEKSWKFCHILDNGCDREVIQGRSECLEVDWSLEECLRTFCEFFDFFPIGKWRGQEFRKQL